MPTINQIQDEIIAEFDLLDEWMARYEYIIELGSELPPYPTELQTPDHLIEGCQSRVWVAGKVGDNGCLQLTAASDALIVKGIIALLLKVLNNQPPKDIAEANLYFIEAIGLHQHLSATRSNGLASMVRHIKLLAAQALM